MFGNNNTHAFTGHNNNLLRMHQQFQQNNTPFQQNQLMMNNPNFTANMNNRMFQQRLYMERMQQIHRAKKGEPMQFKEDELYKYLINPIYVDKAKKEELDKEYKNMLGGYIVEYVKKSKNDIPDEYLQKKLKNGYIMNKKDIEKKVINNKKVKEWWDGRTNQPYKNILKKENYEKKFKNKDDLIVHRVTKKDRNKALLDSELSKLEELLAEHNDQLKIIYSRNQKSQHKKKFQYTNIYKYRMTHNTKNWDELRNFYEKEQIKIDRKEKKIDNMINLLLDGDILEGDEYKSLTSELKLLADKTLKDKEYYITSEIDLEMKALEKDVGKNEYKKIMEELNKEYKTSKTKKYRNQESEIEKLKKNIGKGEYKKIMDELKTDDEKPVIMKKILKIKDRDVVDDSKQESNNNTTRKIKVIMDKEESKEVIKEESKEAGKKSGYVDMSTIEKYKNRTGQVDSDLIKKYREKQNGGK